MNYLSAAEISKRWGCSSRRVTQLCELGRIRGAVKTGKKWRIPENAPKPADNRKRAVGEETEKTPFVQPYILAVVHSQAQIDGFTPDERELYRADCLFEECRYEECIPVVKKLLRTTENPFVRLGALYLLPFLYFYLSDMESMDRYTALFKAECYACEEHRREVEIILASFQAEMSDSRDVASKFQFGSLSDYSDELLMFIASVNAMAEVDRCRRGVSVPNTLPHELICAMIERKGYFYYAMVMHYDISVMYALCHDEANERLHLRRAIDIAVEHHLYSFLTEMILAMPAGIFEALKEYPKEVEEQFRTGARCYSRARTALMQYRGSSDILSALKNNDYLLISYCIRGYSVEKMAGLLGLSISGMKKRLSGLYEKFGVRSKQELAAMYMSAIRNPGAEEE